MPLPSSFNLSFRRATTGESWSVTAPGLKPITAAGPLGPVTAASTALRELAARPDTAAAGSTFLDAREEGRRLQQLWLTGKTDARAEVMAALLAPPPSPLFLAVSMAVLCDRLSIGERGSLLAELSAADRRS